MIDGEAEDGAVGSAKGVELKRIVEEGRPGTTQKLVSSLAESR